eukprot:8771566-Prorocentrum_lima.AAC.1
MTSSLVGSEMCIRDRSCTRARSAALQTFDGPPPVARDYGLRGLPPPGPVSYTHLTLPTICSV